MAKTNAPPTEPLWILATDGQNQYLPLLLKPGQHITTSLPTIEEFTTRELLLQRLDALTIEYDPEIDFVYDDGKALKPPNWGSFNFTLFTQPTFISYGLVCQSINPYLVPALIERYGKIAEIGIKESGFVDYWNTFCTTASVSQEDRDSWAQLAYDNYLPDDFISLISDLSIP